MTGNRFIAESSPERDVFMGADHREVVSVVARRKKQVIVALAHKLLFDPDVRLPVRHKEEQPPDKINDSEGQQRARGLLLREQHQHGDPKRGLLQDRRNHEEPVPNGILSDEQERDLPGHRHPEKTVEVFRVRDGRRILLADP
ncbi:MAG TPA: hypothetical protein VKD72_16690, partial [Gemmataceae bacterium]|nr:hypothetical protein [Gemmataceae bacterium]